MSEPVVTVKQGKLRGILVNGALGSSYIAFKGVPFAAPPIGELRFKDPQPPASWTGIRDATQNVTTHCAQKSDYPPSKFIGDEDCLYLSVYTPSLSQKKPVMFWIHGGAFVTGSGADVVTRPDYLITKDVVLVSTNYRLGAFGFLNLEHNLASGNQGIKDLVLALKWVKENIANFGGDPDNITVFGASAGGALTHCLCISPLSKGLIRNAILQSGNLNCCWAFEERSKYSFKMAALLGKESNDPVEILEFLRTIPAEKIVGTYKKLLMDKEKLTDQLAFGPNIDPQSEEPAFPLPMKELLTNESNINFIIGYSSHEFSMFLKKQTEEIMKTYDDDLPVYISRLIKSDDPIEIDRVTKITRDTYFDGKAISLENIPALIRLLGNVNFVTASNEWAQDRAKRHCAPTYLYKFSYVGAEKTIMHLLERKYPVHGATHVDELSYLFYHTHCKVDDPEPPAIGTRDRRMIERLTRMWTNFAKTGNPTPSLDEYIETPWKSVTENQLNCLDIDDNMKICTAEVDFSSGS